MIPRAMWATHALALDILEAMNKNTWKQSSRKYASKLSAGVIFLKKLS